jgi:hypothetical protein
MGQCILCGRPAAPIATQVMVDGVPIDLCGVDLGLPLAVILLNMKAMQDARRRYAQPNNTDTDVPPPIKPQQQ